MSVYKILKYPHVLLRKKSTPVEKFTPDLMTFTEKMVNTMYAFDGIGLAAPQVGILKRILVLDIRPYLENKDVQEWHGKVKIFIENKEVPTAYPLVLVNPEIVKSEGETEFPFDGCLSFPGVERGETHRAKVVTVEGRLPDNRAFRMECEGIMSICVQHEIDHLDGVLFIDRLNESMSDKEIIEEIKDYESDSAHKKALKKISPVDARNESHSFL